MLNFQTHTDTKPAHSQRALVQGCFVKSGPLTSVISINSVISSSVPVYQRPSSSGGLHEDTFYTVLRFKLMASEWKLSGILNLVSRRKDVEAFGRDCNCLQPPFPQQVYWCLVSQTIAIANCSVSWGLLEKNKTGACLSAEWETQSPYHGVQCLVPGCIHRPGRWMCGLSWSQEMGISEIKSSPNYRKPFFPGIPKHSINLNWNSVFWAAFHAATPL